MPLSQICYIEGAERDGDPTEKPTVSTNLDPRELPET